MEVIPSELLFEDSSVNPRTVHQVAEILYDTGLFDLYAEAYRLADHIIDTFMFGDQ